MIDRRILLLRITYWTGALLDVFYVIPMVLPSLFIKALGLQGVGVDGPLRYISAVGAALMLGWTALLVWADRKPQERRGVLVLTLFPVKVCLDLASLVLLSEGLVPAGKFLLMKIDVLLYYILIIVSLVLTRERKTK